MVTAYIEVTRVYSLQISSDSILHDKLLWLKYYLRILRMYYLYSSKDSMTEAIHGNIA
jgi:hypothetical protein